MIGSKAVLSLPDHMPIITTMMCTKTYVVGQPPSSALFIDHYKDVAIVSVHLQCHKSKMDESGDLDIDKIMLQVFMVIIATPSARDQPKNGHFRFVPQLYCYTAQTKLTHYCHIL